MSIDTNNPYKTPEAIIENLSTQGEGYDSTSLFSPKGRINRTQYFLYYGAIWFASSIISMIVSNLIGFDPYDTNQVFSTKYWIATSIGFLAIPLYIIWTIKRCHDFNYTGWMSLLFLVPLINFVFILFLLFSPGTHGNNRFGNPPKPNSKNSTFYIIGLIIIMFATMAYHGYQAYNQFAY